MWVVQPNATAFNTFKELIVLFVPAAITGWGTALPSDCVDNAQLIERNGFKTTPEKILGLTGIKERRVAGKDQTPASLAIEAGGKAITCAGLSPADIGCCVVATCSPQAS